MTAYKPCSFMEKKKRW